jgi:hypothetical protein
MFFQSPYKFRLTKYNDDFAKPIIFRKYTLRIKQYLERYFFFFPLMIIVGVLNLIYYEYAILYSHILIHRIGAEIEPDFLLRSILKSRGEIIAISIILGVYIVAWILLTTWKTIILRKCQLAYLAVLVEHDKNCKT